MPLAQFKISDDGILEKLDRLDAGMRRDGIRRIVMAGADAEIAEMSERTQSAHHVRTGQMMQQIGAADYHEELGGGRVNVYPQGTDSRGVSNAMKAFVINYGIGRNPTRKGKANRTGDKFITKQATQAKEKVQKAMAAEASAIFNEMTGGN